MVQPQPQPDESAYSGDIIVKSTTFGKSNHGKTTGVSKVRQAITALNDESAKRLTLDCIDPNSALSVENQIIINKELAAILRKQALMLTTFVKNNS